VLKDVKNVMAHNISFSFRFPIHAMQPGFD
jgi:hypothetical protein